MNHLIFCKVKLIGCRIVYVCAEYERNVESIAAGITAVANPWNQTKLFESAFIIRYGESISPGVKFFQRCRRCFRIKISLSCQFFVIVQKMYVCILRYQVRLSIYLNEVIKTIKETVGINAYFWEKVIYCHKGAFNRKRVYIDRRVGNN